MIDLHKLMCTAHWWTDLVDMPQGHTVEGQLDRTDLSNRPKVVGWNVVALEGTAEDCMSADSR